MRVAHSIFVIFAFFLVLRTIFVCQIERYSQHYLGKLIQQEARNVCQPIIPRVFKSDVTLQLAFTTILESAAGIEYKKKSGTPLKPEICRFGRWIHTFRILALQENYVFIGNENIHHIFNYHILNVLLVFSTNNCSILGGINFICQMSSPQTQQLLVRAPLQLKQFLLYSLFEKLILRSPISLNLQSKP